MESLIVTGSSGLIGSALINRVGPRFTEFALDREGPPHPPPESEEVISCDLSSDESVVDALETIRRKGRTRIASVIHLAAYYDFSGEPSPLYEQITIRGTERLLRALRPFEVEQFVFASTMLIHAPCEPGQRISEESPIEPKWEYPKSKVATEELILSERGAIPVVFLRMAGVYDEFCHSIPIAHQIQRIHERQLIGHVYPGDTDRGQSFLHIDDLTDAIARVIDRRGQLPDVTAFLLGEPDTLSYDEMQRTISGLLHGEEWDTRRIPKPLAKSGAWLQDRVPGVDPFIKPWMIDIADDHYAVDITCAREVLGWEPRRSLRSELPRIIGHLKADPERWYRENKLDHASAS